MFVAYVPLYSKLSRHQICEGDVRARLLDYLRDHPGTSFSGLKGQLGLASGSLTYHLGVLEREGYLISTKQKGRRRYHHPDDTPSPVDNTPTLSPVRLQITNEIQSRGRATIPQLMERFDLSRQLLRYHLKALEKAGMITNRREGRMLLFRPASTSTSAAAPAAAPADLREQLRGLVERMPGVTMAQLKDEVGVHTNRTWYQMQNLVEKGIVRRQKVGNIYCFHPGS